VGAVAALTMAAVTAALWPAAASIGANWVEIRDYQHGFLVAPLALGWLAWDAWRMRLERLQPSLPALGCLAAALAVWLVAFRAQSDIAMETLFPIVAWLALYAVAGWKIAREAAAPIAYLYFAIPVWEFLLPALQWLSVHVTEAALALAGIPAQVDEYLVTLPAGSFEIVEGCSGKRYFVVALAVSVIAGVLRQLRGWRLAALVACGGALALAANWFRIFVVIAAGHVTEMRHYLVAVEHQTFGNVVFAFLLVAIYVAAAVASRVLWPVVGTARPTSAPTPAAGRRAPAAAAPFLLLAVVAMAVFIPVQASPRRQELAPLPVAAAAWHGPLPPVAAWSPQYVAPDAEMRASYRRAGGGVVQLYLNLYRAQEPGRELIYFRNSLLAPGPWTRAWPQWQASLETAGSPALATVEVRSPDGGRWLLAYVYKVGTWTTHRESIAQASYGFQSLWQPVPAGVISLTVQCRENCQDARALVQVFWHDMSSSLLGMIPDDAA
jgi:EpsI family protein